MRIILSESQLRMLVKEQDAWATKAASGPQKCGITKGQDSGDNSKELKSWDKEVARQNKIESRERAIANKNFLSLNYDRSSFPLDKNERRQYIQQYQDFINSNPGLIDDGDGFNSQQKYAIISKTLDFIKKVPQISYTINLGKKFGLNSSSTLKDVINVINQMGGYTLYMDWFNSGGPIIK